MLKKITSFCKSKPFLYIFLICLFIFFSIIFFIYAPLLAFNDIYIFSNAFVRLGILVLVWLIVAFYFMFRPLLDFLQTLKSEKGVQRRELKKEVARILHKAKRNYSLALNEAKSTWKRTIRFKDIPLVIIIGNEGAGKSSLINYANIEYPLSDKLESYKKIHKSTKNFNLYVSKKGALLDTEGNYFTQEDFFNPDTTDEIAEDDLEKNKDFLIKKAVWNKFLSFLNSSIFHSKLNGIVLVIDVHSFLNNPKQYSDNLIHFLVKRVHECEQNLNLKLPIYVVFSKLDLMEGMDIYWNVFNENVANKILGITLEQQANKQTLLSYFQAISKSLLYSFMHKNKSLHSLDEKNGAFLFLKQLDTLFALVVDFVIQVNEKNVLKNKSYVRGIYFTSAYQENVPRNYLVDAVCEKYAIKKPAAKAATKQHKRSYFVHSMLEQIVLKDSHLNSMILKNSWVTLRLGVMAVCLCILTYSVCAYYINKAYKAIEQSNTSLNSINALLADANNYNTLSLYEKVNLMLNLKAILKEYPLLFDTSVGSQYFFLDTSYQAFLPAKDLYYAISEDVVSKTLINEMEYILAHNKTPETLVETLYMYMSLFDTHYLDKSLLAVWIGKNWQYFKKYNIPKDDFIASTEDLASDRILNAHPMNIGSVTKAQEEIMQIAKAQRIYILIAFKNSLEKQATYNIKNKIGRSIDAVFEAPEKLSHIDKRYTKEGLMVFLSHLEKNMHNALDIDLWYLEGVEQDNDEKMLDTKIIEVYLADYKKKWEDILQAIKPKRHHERNALLNELQILSQPSNPINNLIGVINDNTHLNDTLLLGYVYGLGFSSKEIKTQFTALSNHFKAYYDLTNEESLIDSKANSLSQSKNKELANSQNATKDENNMLEVIAQDVQNVSAKIEYFTQDITKDAKEKIVYILDGSNDENDPFKKLDIDSKVLPQELKAYYNHLARMSWKIIESNAGVLLNSVWKNEVYTDFVNNISPLYPFNTYSRESVSIETFKGFFGNAGTLQTFYKQYLSKIIQKKGGAYIPNPTYMSKIKLKEQFLTFFNKTSSLSAMFDANNNLTLNFFIQCLDLSSDFSSLDMGYNDTSIHYDHTLHPKLHIIIEHFNKNTELRLTANDYYQYPQYKKVYIGEWAWFAFIKDMVPNQNMRNSIYFENNKKLYFDFNITNKTELLKILDTLTHFNMPDSIM